ncbi:MAG: hypothetical protein ACOYJU_07920 [Anaerovoracaceae bacterium]|jgi:hypothetical protein
MGYIRIKGRELATSLMVRFSWRQRMIYYLFWAAYGMEVEVAGFEEFFKAPLMTWLFESGLPW